MELKASSGGRRIHGRRAVPDWQYRKLQQNQHAPRRDELDMLNAAGAEGWELVGITSNNVAYLKREIEPETCAGLSSTAASGPSRRAGARPRRLCPRSGRSDSDAIDPEQGIAAPDCSRDGRNEAGPHC